MVFEAPWPSNVHVWSSRAVVCEPRRPGLVGPPGFHTTAREPKRAHLSVPVFKNTTKIQRENPQRGKKRTNFLAGREKKERNFGRSRGRAVQGKGGPGEGRSRGRAVQGKGGPGRGPKILNTKHHQQHHQQAPTSTNRHQQANNNNNNRKFGQNIKTPKLAKCGLAKCGQHFETLILAKCGLAKCGHENKLAKFGFFWPNAVNTLKH